MPDPTKPISEVIIDDVVDVLEGVTIALGYRVNLTVERELTDGNSPRDGLAVVMVGDVMPQNGPLGLDEFQLPIGVQIYAIESADIETPIKTRLATMAADVRTALMLDVHRDGHAVNTLWPEPDKFYTEQAPKSVMLVPHIQFRTLRGNPYER